MKFRLPGRKSVTSKEELSMLTAFELTLELAAAGWTPSEHGRSKKLDAYKEGTPKCWYYSDKHDQTLMKSYLMTLLRSPALFSSGLKEVHHFQIRAYYEAILSSPQPGKVLANQPAAYYTVLLQNEARPQRDRRDPATLASDDDGGLNLPPPVVSPAALAGDDSRADTGKLPKRKAAVPPADMAAKGKLPKRQPGAGSKRALASEAAFDEIPWAAQIGDEESPDPDPESESDYAEAIPPLPQPGPGQESAEGIPPPPKPGPGQERQRRQGGGRPVRGGRGRGGGRGSASIFKESTVWCGPIPLVERTDAGKVPSFFVNCPLHGTAERSCTKSIQINQPTLEIAQRRLMYWLVAGFSLQQLPGETAEVIPTDTEQLGSREDLIEAVENLAAQHDVKRLWRQTEYFVAGPQHVGTACIDLSKRGFRVFVIRELFY
ncbi:hypothetical protein AK812_SmicGene46043 [Symbiodinium microadriaticum]|uniref:Uncharacterized protein n=1 Tax=Symbiodinium microadriaticum TaxID=2951 RepID=A0A1Q9BUR1_SYMMI|nr:hypothetical protein AK812_SmicGene46043 [Symbiodinium microadriaticum]